MNMPAISASAISRTGACVFAALLWYLSGRPFKLANTSQELLDFFEVDTIG